jgi:hypothetical protein
MNTLDDLRRSLDGRATGASDGHGLVQAVQEGAIRIRRRRRIAGAAAAACLVAAAAVAVPVVVARQRADHPPVVATTPPYRQPGQATLRLAAGSKYYPAMQSAELNVQRLLAASGSRSAPGNRGEVIAYDPGTFDPAVLQRGTRTSVSGHAAWLVPDYHFANEAAPGPVLGWQDPSGVWVLASQSRAKLNRPSLNALAAAVRIGPARPLATPFQFASAPRGVPLSAVVVEGGPKGFTDARASFGGGQAAVLSPSPNMPENPPLLVFAIARDYFDLARVRAELTRIAPITGNAAWYGEGTSDAPGSGGHLLVDAGTCGVQFVSADRAKISRDALAAMAATATYADCADPSTWTAPLSR